MIISCRVPAPLDLAIDHAGGPEVGPATRLPSRRHSLALLLLALPVAAGGVLAGEAAMSEKAEAEAKDGAHLDWPCWRGPEGTGISRETGFLKTWPEGGPRELWRIPLGSGFSSFAAVGDRLYTQEETDGRQRVVCLASDTGRALWSHDLEEGYRERQGGDGPRATPAVKDGVVYALGARGSLAALHAADGKPVWQINVLEKFGAENITWGLSGSPLVEGDVVIVPVGARGAPLVAFDLATGETAWRSGSDGQGDLAGYSTPCAITYQDQRRLLVVLGRSLLCLEADSGKVEWRYFWKTDFDVNAAAPVYHDGHVFISSGYGHGCAVLRFPEGKGGYPKEVWKSKVLENKFSSSVLHEGHLYGFDNTILKCVEFRTGTEKWRSRGFGYGSLLLADGHLIVLGDAGDLAVVKADPAGYVETARKKGVLRGSVAWTVPVLHRGVLYLRNLEEAVAISLRAEGAGG